MPNIIRLFADAVPAVVKLTPGVIPAFPAAAGQPNDRRRRDGRSVPSHGRHSLISRLAAVAEANQSRRDRHLLETASWFPMLAECVADNFDRNSRQRARGPRPGSGFRSSTSRGRGGKSFGGARRQYERYIALVDAAVLRGDSIEAQNYYQHAEHYFRVMNGVDA